MGASSRLAGTTGRRKSGGIDAGSSDRGHWAIPRRIGLGRCTDARCWCCGRWWIRRPARRWQGRARGGHTYGRGTQARSPSPSPRPATGRRRAGSFAFCLISTSRPRPGSVGTASRSRAAPRRATPPAGSLRRRGQRESKLNRYLAIGAGGPTTRRKTTATTSATRSPPLLSMARKIAPATTNRPVGGGGSSPLSAFGEASCARPATPIPVSTPPRRGRCNRSGGRHSSRQCAARCCSS